MMSTTRESGVKAVLVGEDNPYGIDPKFALWPGPKRSAGYRLCTKVLGLTRCEYLRDYVRVNLCPTRWSIVEARNRARFLLEDCPGSTLVLLGSKVCKAFNVAYSPFAVRTLASSGRRLVVLPHPSGRCREWNKENAVERARAVLKEVGAL